MSNYIIDTPSFETIQTDELKQLVNVFEQNNYKIRLVGGVVRDLLLNEVAKDIDLATDATPQQMITILEEKSIKCIETGVQHGTITAVINEKPFEITTLRIDTVTDGRHAQVEFTDDWRVDAERRDLTINAMFLSLDGTLYDYFNGRDDLTSKRIAFVGDAKARITEDYLRILRYFRFYGRIAANCHDHDPQVLDVIRQTAPGLEQLAVERIWLEVSKILVGNFATDLVKLMYNLTVAEHIKLPNNGNLKEFQMVYNRMLNGNPKPAVMLVSLIDTVQEAENLARAWKLSKEERLLMNFIANRRNLNYGALKDYQDLMFDNETHSKDDVIQLMLYKGHSLFIDDFRNWTVPKLPVDGRDLKALGFKPSPQFTTILNRLREQWMNSNYSLTKDELLQKV